MTEPPAQEPATDPLEAQVPAPVLKARSRISIVWLVPVVAALIGLWIPFKAWREQGPTVLITFENAEGLEAGKTRIKYKDVQVGHVESIRLSEDLKLVVVKARLEKDMEPYLSASTRFWVVRARVSMGQVSGLGTLLSGAYIGIDPGSPGEPKGRGTLYQGLDAPPPLVTNQPGRLFTLQSERLGSLDIGSPVNYRQIKVGEVVSYDLQEAGRSVNIRIFVNAPYNRLVHKDTRFWLAGGMELAVDANGVRMDVQPLATMLLGGISFETPMSLDVSEAAEKGQIFPLYDSHEKTFEKIYMDKSYYVMNFTESVRGLSRGAPVEFRGIKVGEVADIKLEFQADRLEAQIPVLIALEPERFATFGRKAGSVDDMVEKLVERGLRAQLKAGSLLTGQVFVDLDLHPEAPGSRLVRNGKYPELPTVPTTLGTVTASITDFLRRLQKLPIEQVLEELRATLPAVRSAVDHAGRMLDKVDNQTLPQVKAALEQAQRTMAKADKVLAADSPVQQDVRTTLAEVEKAARSLRVLTDYLEQHPNALIFGKGKQP